MSIRRRIVRHSGLCALICALLVASPLQAADAAAGYEGWAFAGAREAALSREFSHRSQQIDFSTHSAATDGAGSLLGLKLSRAFENGLTLDAGVAHSQADAQPHIAPVDYQDAFLGFRYNQLTGQVWYLDEPDASGLRSLYYQAGWKTPVTDQFSLSLQMGQAYRQGRFQNGYPDLSIAAEGEIEGYGLGIRLIDRSGLGSGNQDGYSLMGSISRRFR